MATFRKPCFSRTEIVASLVLGLLLGVLLTAAYGKMGGKGAIIDSLARCRSIVQDIKIYASDRLGRYPDSAVPTAKHSNAAFKQLFIEQVVDDEKQFGCAHSPFVPDGVIGSAPNYDRAVEAGENHWAMTKGLHESSPGNVPLVYETPVEAAWEPVWNADVVEIPAKGRVWTRGRVIIGRNDGSVAAENLASLTGKKVPLKVLGTESKNNLFTLFETLDDGAKLEVLDVETSSASVAREFWAKSWPQLTVACVLLVLLAVIAGIIRKKRRVTTS